ncbi:hypothetical protein VE03_01419 [Pseudogymnoascus sp. 23342-1-I1]|nr:hypothetical protein VE03_01419 [Pseudogymnoascus sp. 23342-1-I1]
MITTAISFVATLGLCILSPLEHSRSVRPSSLALLFLVAYLSQSVFALLAPAFKVDVTEHFIVTTIRLILGTSLLLSESGSKRDVLKHAHRDRSPEELSGVVGRTFFWWINDVLRNGNNTILDPTTLPHNDQYLASNLLRSEMIQTWNQRAKPESKATLPLTLLYCLKYPFASAILPRLFLIVFRYSQAILIKITIQYVTSSNTQNDSVGIGYLLIAVSLFIYIGMAVSTAVYQHLLNRLQVMVRGALVGLIHHRSLNVQLAHGADQSSVSLMSTDVDSIDTIGEMFHETWAQLLEVILGTVMLAEQIVCSQMSRYVAKHLQSKQKAWSVATQNRLAIVSDMLAATKCMKMLGLTETWKSYIRVSRKEEIEASKRLRWIMVAYNASANALGIFSPVVTLVAFAIFTKHKDTQVLDADTVFTSIALLAMVTHPANMVMTIIPRVVSCTANFERIQTYLLGNTRGDQRFTLKREPRWNSRSAENKTRGDELAVTIKQLTIQKNSTSEPILKDIDLDMQVGTIVVCSGQVGTGKTCLALAILGEIPLSSGSISVATKRIGYCAQLPWLPSSSIEDVILGPLSKEDTDSEWYTAVIDACGLRKDIESLPEKDKTQIGSRGVNLSGGQRQRLALARAVYARNEILVLDDPFSSLDGKTETSIVENLLGIHGLLRKSKTTVFLITNAGKSLFDVIDALSFFPLSDQIIILSNSKIQNKGTWDEIKHNALEIKKIIMMPSEADDNSILPTPDVIKTQARHRAAEDAARDLTRKTGDFQLYGYYFKAVGSLNISILIACTACYSFFLTFSQYWLKWWTESRPDQTWFYIGGYLAISTVAWLTTNGTMWSTHIKIAPRSGIVLHDSLLTTIVGAPLSYYARTDIGIMLNRFGQDFQLVDKQLPSALANICNQIFKLLMQIALLFGVQKALIATLPFCIGAVYVIQRIYLRTSRQLRLIELESRSAVYSSFLETIDGIATIRAFAWQSGVTADNILCLEQSQGPFYLLICLQRWLNVVLDLLIAGVAACVIALAISFRHSTSGAQVGVALNLILAANTTLLRLVECWTTLEISLGAIARLKSTVSDTPKEEKPGETLHPQENWPSSGAIELKDVSVSYNPGLKALSNVSLKILAGQRVLVCGRTGSGKSTLLLALLHLLEFESGSIWIDGIDISLVSRLILRQQCYIVIPQDPFVFSNATLRANIDTSSLLLDETLIVALKRTHLWQHFSPHGSELQHVSPEPKGVLDTNLSDLPSLSTGQLQLLSLTRAILQAQSRRGPSSSYLTSNGFFSSRPIVILDEATSSLDPDTEAVVQDIIQEEFSRNGHTVIAVSHRTLASSKQLNMDAVVWIEDGRVTRVEGLELAGTSNVKPTERGNMI